MDQGCPLRIPKKFPVKGKEWEVEYKWKLYDKEFGFCNGIYYPNERKIKLDRFLTMPNEKENKQFIFLHELLHAIHHESHLNEYGCLDPKIEEIINSSVATVFTDLFDIKFKKKFFQND